MEQRVSGCCCVITAVAVEWGDIDCSVTPGEDAEVKGQSGDAPQPLQVLLRRRQKK